MSDFGFVQSGNNSGGTVTSVGLSTGTSGTDINVSSSPVTGSGTLLLNIPTASASNRGALNSSDWSTFNSKQSGSAALTQISSLSPSNDDIIQRKSGIWVNRSVSQYYNDLAPFVKNDVYFTIPFFPASLSPADSTTYYIGAGAITPSTTATNQDLSFGYDITVIGAVILASGNTASGTTEDSTMQIRNTTTSTSSLLGTFKTNGSSTVIIQTSITGTSISIDAAQTFCLQWDAPAYATNPTACSLRTILICKRR
jgi:hypothetical protein